MNDTLEIFTDSKDIIQAIKGFQANIEKFWGAYVNASIPSFSTREVKQGYSDARKRGVDIRYITEITKENMLYCTEIMEYAELRHIDGVKGAFAISDTEYIIGINDGDKLTGLIRTDVKELVRQQKYIFDKLWNFALPAKERIIR
jgi:hypothetical protein